MKRNIGVVIMAIAQILRTCGIDLEIGEEEVTAIGTAVGAGITLWGVIHDIVRRWRARKNKKS